LSKAYDEASKKFGYQNYKHYLNESKKRTPLKLARPMVSKKSPLIPVKVTGGARDLFKDILILKDQEPEMAFTGLAKIIKDDNDPFRRSHAIQTLINNFDIPFSEIYSLLAFIPKDYLVTVWNYLKLEYDIESFIYNYYLNDGHIHLYDFATHPMVDEASIGNVNYSFTDQGIEASGDFDLSVELQYGSDGDNSRGNGYKTSHRFSGDFNIRIDSNKMLSILSIELDDSSFYK